METLPKTCGTRVADLIIRPPTGTETARAAYLFRHGLLRPQSRLLVALRSQPVERFVAAAAWWTEGAVARFHAVCQPGVASSEVSGSLISQVADAARRAGMQRLQYADLLANTDAWRQILIENGFEPLGTNRFFEASCPDAYARVMRLFEQHQSDIPADWHTESIRHHSPQLALDLIGEHGLLPSAELDCYWHAEGTGGFDLDVSSFLLDGGHPVGVFLTRVSQDTFFVDVRVVRIKNRLLRALGNLILFHHTASRWDPAGPLRRLQFHGGQAEHRETANLAFRTGGHELPPRHIYAKNL